MKPNTPAPTTIRVEKFCRVAQAPQQVPDRRGHRRDRRDEELLGHRIAAGARAPRPPAPAPISDRQLAERPGALELVGGERRQRRRRRGVPAVAVERARQAARPGSCWVGCSWISAAALRRATGPPASVTSARASPTPSASSSSSDEGEPGASEAVGTDTAWIVAWILGGAPPGATGLRNGKRPTGSRALGTPRGGSRVSGGGPTSCGGGALRKPLGRSRAQPGSGITRDSQRVNTVSMQVQVPSGFGVQTPV
jgi:hypothetical protein